MRMKNIENQQNPGTLVDLLRDVWKARLYIFAGLLIGCAGAISVQFTTVPHYESSMIIAPAHNMNGADSSSLGADSDFFLLRYMVQHMGLSGSSDFLRFENMYAGASVAKMLLEDPNIQKGLERDQAFLLSEPQEQWTADQLAEYIHKRVIIDPVGATPMRTMRYAHPSKAFGQYFLHNLHKKTDSLIRAQTRNETEQRIAYIKQEIRQNTNPDHKKALINLLMEQERLRMMVSIGTPYAATVIEPPSSSVKTTWPSLTLLWSLCSALGMFLGFVVFNIKNAFSDKSVRTQKSNQPTGQNKSKTIYHRRPLTGHRKASPEQTNKRTST